MCKPHAIVDCVQAFSEATPLVSVLIVPGAEWMLISIHHVYTKMEYNEVFKGLIHGIMGIMRCGTPMN